MGEELGLYLAFGSLAGVLSGLFGIGGGVVIVPFLVWFFSKRGFPPDSVMIMAVATSLATIVVTSISAVYAHHRLGAVRWNTVFRLAPGILIGSIAGSVIADQLPAHWFKLIFALFLLYVGGRILIDLKTESSQNRVLSGWLYSAAGVGIGAVSSILGIGGGTLSVPFLVKCRFPIRNAVAISSACGFPIAVAGSLTYIALGWEKPVLPVWSLGYVYLPAFAGIVTTSIPFAPVGAKLAHRVPTRKLRRMFAVVVFIVGAKLLWQAVRPWIEI
ncbi:sulfite exporter TauE/SafE family protein [Methylocaldum sp.]|uniref:sulfite exporter TauE/SafE family protein n=1 Tax=Methylocaldum sp. TaxID=1969727 RepID=UPI002D71A7A2|nr:sulfite exporter TauE/SafE family protein [Methylocaldum sp.]HYE35763.1 sulfite exporter TauE/SafE family protein [Methylocaldum sp.]